MIPRPLIVTCACCLAFVLAYASFSAVLHALPAGERHAEILAYLDMPFSGEPPEVLTDAEASHMRDVKRLLDIALAIHVLSIGTLIGAGVGLWRHREELFARVLKGAGYGLIGTGLFLLLAALLGFGKLFVLMHALLFPQGNWLFPADSVLIATYPLSYFQSFAVWWLTLGMSAGAVVAVTGIFVARMAGHARRFPRR